MTNRHTYRLNLITSICLSILFLFKTHAQNFERAQEQTQRFVNLTLTGSDTAIYLGHRLAKEFEGKPELEPLLPRVYLSIGNFYKDRGDLPKAIEYYQLTEDKATALDDTVFIAYAKGSIGYVYSRTGRHSQALEVYQKNLDLWQQRQEAKWIPTACHNIIKCLNELDRPDSIPYYINYGLHVADSALILRGRADLEYDQAYYLFVHDSVAHTDEISSWLEKSEQTGRKNFDTLLVHKVFLLKAQVAIKNGFYQKADGLCQEVFNRLINRDIARPLFLKSCECLVETKQKLGQEEKALQLMWLLTNTNDSLSGLSEVNQLNKLELNHGLYKKSMQDSLAYVYAQNEAEMALEADKKRHQIITWIGILAGLIVLSLAIYLFRNYQTRKVALRKLELVTTEIKDSINYAFRIQNAFLPKPELLTEWFDDAFVLYLPKDVVAGDFYWFEEYGDWVVVAAADCTGHGVPGAMVSVVCHSALQKSLAACGPEDPSAILKKTSELVTQRFTIDQTAMKDGMDIGLCCFNRTSKTLVFSGAHNPIWLVRSGELTEFKGVRRPVGYYDGPVNFANHSIKLHEGDTLYLSSDGYADQFGGGSGKKMKSKALKQKILANAHSNMQAQKKVLETEFYKWMDGYEQLDDVCVIGVKI